METCGVIRTYHRGDCDYNYDHCDCNESSGTKIKEEYFQNNGKIEGEYKRYHINGQLYEICNYINDRKNGEYKEYYDNGQLREICNYIDGKKEG